MPVDIMLGLLLLLRAAALPRLAAVPAAGKLVGKVVDLNYYPWYLVTSERASAGAFASREVLPMSSLTEKERWCDLHLKRLQADPNATPKGGWSRVCAAPASNASRWTKWRADNAWSGCPAKQFVAGIPGGSVLLHHAGAGGVLVTGGKKSYPVHLGSAQKHGSASTIIDGHVAHAFGVYPREVAHSINQFPRLLRVARNVPANRTTLLVHDTRLWREWVGLLRRRRLIPDTLRVRYVPVHRAGTIMFRPKNPADKLYFAGEAVPVFPGGARRSGGWYTLEEETCSFQLALNRSYVGRLLAACPDPAEAAHVREPPVRLGNATANGSCVVEVLVVSRQDARSRAVRNHDQLLETVSASLGRALPACAVRLRIFVGKDHSLTSAAAVWHRAHVVVAPHGAALANIIFVQPGTLVVELGYYSAASPTRPYASTVEGLGMPWPAPYYWAAAASAEATLFASMAIGSYSGPMTANLEDVAALMANQIAPRLRRRPDLTGRHLRPPWMTAVCPPARDGIVPA